MRHQMRTRLPNLTKQLRLGIPQAHQAAQTSISNVSGRSVLRAVARITKPFTIRAQAWLFCRHWQPQQQNRTLCNRCTLILALRCAGEHHAVSCKSAALQAPDRQICSSAPRCFRDQCAEAWHRAGDATRSADSLQRGRDPRKHRLPAVAADSHHAAQLRNCTAARGLRCTCAWQWRRHTCGG